MSSTRRTLRFRDVALAGVVLVGGPAACSEPDLGTTPFRCSPQQDSCPAGYHCDLQQCVHDGATVPAFLSSSLAPDDASFTLQQRRGDTAICFRNSLEARQPQFSVAILRDDGTLAGPPVLLFGEGADSPTSLIGWAAGCGIVDDQVVTVPIRSGAGVTLVQRFFTVNPLTGQRRSFSDDLVFTSSASLTQTGITQFAMGSDGSRAWMVYPRNISSIDMTQTLYITSITTAGGVVSSSTSSWMQAPLLDDATYLRSVQLLPATGGNWLAASQNNDRLQLIWGADGATVRATPVDLGLPPEWLAAPLAVSGAQLAMAFRTRFDSTSARWQVYWLTPSTDPSGSTVVAAAPGPAFDMPVGVLRPGGVVDAASGALGVAGASDAHAVQIWSVPWGAPAGASDPAPVSSIAKTSRLVPARLALGRRGGIWQVAWSERADDASAGGTTFTTLYAAVGH